MMKLKYRTYKYDTYVQVQYSTFTDKLTVLLCSTCTTISSTVLEAGLKFETKRFLSGSKSQTLAFPCTISQLVVTHCFVQPRPKLQATTGYPHCLFLAHKVERDTKGKAILQRADKQVRQDGQNYPRHYSLAVQQWHRLGLTMAMLPFEA
jgi:hypothetical protein